MPAIDPGLPPTVVAVLERLARPEDAGAGDTVERLAAAAVVPRWLAGIAARMGLPCGCEERRRLWNQLHPWE